MSQPVVGIIMGSQSDWPTLKPAAAILETLAIAHESRIVSAHRTPDRMSAYAKGAAGRGIKVIIAAAGGAAHLPGMTASMTTLPVLGVPGRIQGTEGHGQPSFHRPDAGRRTGRDVRHRREPARRTRRFTLPPFSHSPIPLLPSASPSGASGRRRPWTSFPPTNERNQTSRRPGCPRRHDRDSRRRPARPHAGTGRGAARTENAHLCRRRGRARISGVRHRARTAHYTDHAALAAFARAATP